MLIFLFLNRGSLHTRSFRRMQIFVFQYRLTKLFCGPGKFPGLSRNRPQGPRNEESSGKVASGGHRHSDSLLYAFVHYASIFSSILVRQKH